MRRFGAVRLTGNGRWYVYGLFDDDQGAFYIGMSQNPTVRAAQHVTGHDVTGRRIREIEKRGGCVHMMVLADFATREEALAAETSEIRRRSGLVNKSGYGPVALQRRRQAVADRLPGVAEIVVKAAAAHQRRRDADDLKYSL